MKWPHSKKLRLSWKNSWLHACSRNEPITKRRKVCLEFKNTPGRKRDSLNLLLVFKVKAVTQNYNRCWKLWQICVGQLTMVVLKMFFNFCFPLFVGVIKSIFDISYVYSWFYTFVSFNGCVLLLFFSIKSTWINCCTGHSDFKEV